MVNAISIETWIVFWCVVVRIIGASMLHIEGLLEDNDAVPLPHSIDEHQRLIDYQGATWALVDVDLDKLMGPAERINITVPRFALKKIDSAAARSGMNRSQFLVKAALAASGNVANLTNS